MTDHPLALQVPATSANLGAGFDTFGVALDLHLTVAVTDATTGPRVRCTGEGAADLPEDDANLVWSSAVRRAEALGERLPDVRLVTRNEIPLARGLGSSSAAIVAGLVLADELLGRRSGTAELAAAATAIEGHPDNVVPALVGGLTTSVRADDERLVVRRVTPHARLRAVVLVPEGQQLTSEARSVLPESLPRSAVGEQVARAGHVLGALMGGWPLDAGSIGDRLHEPARLAVMPASDAVVGQLRAAGVPAWLSGAGPSVLAAVGSRDEATASAVGAIGAQAGFRVDVLDWDLSGARACPADGCGLTSLSACAACPRRRLA